MRLRRCNTDHIVYIKSRYPNTPKNQPHFPLGVSDRIILRHLLMLAMAAMDDLCREDPDKLRFKNQDIPRLISKN